MAINFARLRQQNLFQPPPIDINAGIMGEINFPNDPNFGEGPSDYEMGQVNLPQPQEPYFGGNYQVQNDPRAVPIAGPASIGAGTAENLEDVINRIYTPETESRDRFNRLLDAAPERESPGLMRGLAAFGMGMGAKDPLDTLKVHEAVMYAPHLRNMQDWSAKTQPFGTAAELENRANINERTLAGNVATATVNQQRYDQQNTINEEKNRIAELNAESKRIRDTAYAYTQRLGKGWTPITTGPTVQMMNKDTGEIMDTGMPTGKLSEQDKIELQNYGRIEASRVQGQNAATVAGINQSERWVDRQGNVYNLNPNQVGDAETMGLRPITPGAPQFPNSQITRVPTSAGAASAQQPRVDRNNRFQQLADERPDLAQKWLIPPVSATGNWGIKPPPTGRDGWFWDTPVNATDMQEYNAVREALGLPPMPAVQPQAAPAQVPPPAGSQGRGVGPSVVPRAPAPYIPPTTGPDPFMGGVTGPQDPFAQPPIQPGQNLGTPGGVVQGARESLRPQPDNPAVIASELAKGTRLVVTDPSTGKVVGSIPNTSQSIEAATNAGLRVEVK
jgi:hypothetical protein